MNRSGIKLHKMKRNLRLGILLFGLFSISCSSSRGPGLVEIARRPMPLFVPPSERDLPDYLIDFGDMLEIKFFNNERFDETVKVRPDGRITLQRYGDLLVVGRTPAQVDSVITQSYAGIIKDPEVPVFVREFGMPEVYVLGEVPRPGAVPFRGMLTALQAVSLAGGPSREAKMSSVLIIRQENNQIVAARWDLKELIQGDLAGGDPPVKPFDIIYIPRTFISKVGDFLDSYLPAILTPLDLSIRWFYYQKLIQGDSNQSITP